MSGEKLKFDGPPETPEEEIAFRDARYKHAREQMELDPLTQLKNRGSFWRAFEDCLAAASKESSKDVSLVHIDIDHFKTINDTLGHSAGDEVLRELGALLHGAVGESGLAARVGGEELTLLLPDTSIKDARTKAEELRAHIEAIRFRGFPSLRVTASFGVVSSKDSTDPQTLYNLSDKKLYEAKQSGRNRVVAS